MSKVIPREVYEMLHMLGLSNVCAGRAVEGYGFILPEITVTPFEARPRETYYNVEYSHIVIPEAPRPEAIPADAFGIIVLLNSSGAPSSSFGSFGHAAVLIGNERIGWNYISKDGYDGTIGKGPSKYIVKEFRSFAQFKASAHNHSLMDGYDSHTTTLGTEIDSLDYRVERDGMGRPTERYDKALFIPSKGMHNALALIAANRSAKKPYFLMRYDCSHVVTEALRAAKKIDGEHNLGDIPNISDIFLPNMGNIEYSPDTKHEKIKKRNPDAREIE